MIRPLPKRSKLITKVYSTLQEHPSKLFSTTDLIEEGLVINKRQARYVCNILVECHLLDVYPNIYDCRSSFYQLKR